VVVQELGEALDEVELGDVRQRSPAVGSVRSKSVTRKSRIT
jgi:hypothetical protein